MGSRNRLGRAWAALAACAAAAALAGGAQATTIDETTDFSNGFPPTLLPLGTDGVNGSLSVLAGDPLDFITFQGLAPGAGFELGAIYIGGAFDNFLIAQFDAGGVFLQAAADSGASLAGAVPAGGELHIGISVGPISSAAGSYQLTLAVPEPAGSALLGGALLAAAGLRRGRAHPPS
jgi:hypothetical protein